MNSTKQLTETSMVISLFMSIYLFSRQILIIKDIIGVFVGVFIVLSYLKTQNIKYVKLSVPVYSTLFFTIEPSMVSIFESILSITIGFVCIRCLMLQNSNYKLDFLIGTLISGIIFSIYEYMLFKILGFNFLIDVSSLVFSTCNQSNLLIYSLFCGTYICALYMGCKLGILDEKAKFKYMKIHNHSVLSKIRI